MTSQLNRAPSVAEKRGYAIRDVESAREVASTQLEAWALSGDVIFGLPEIDDRYHVWRVPLVGEEQNRVGEIVIDARTAEIDLTRSSDRDTVRARVEGWDRDWDAVPASDMPQLDLVGRSAILAGDSEQSLQMLQAESVDLVFTSPPYYNARPDYVDYASYDEYLEKVRRVIRECHRVLAEGRFFVMNVAPVLIRRSSRSESSKRIAVPFDMHRIFVEEGFDFIDDIIWEKPSGAGWATGRGRRFAADRQPLQYKAVPVTEYVLVYRKRTDKLIDWNIRSHQDQDAVAASRINGEYEQTNVWRIKPAHSKDHPAIFPVELADRVVQYYSFKGDTVLDPFAGIGTLGEAAATRDRRFVLCEIDEAYVDTIKRSALKWLGSSAAEIYCVGTSPVETDGLLF